MDKSIETFKAILLASRSKLTTARLSLFKLLLGSRPLSISEILDKASNEIDRVSVYRNVELFEKLNIVRRITVGWKYKIELSDIFVAHHHHLVCLKCGTIIDIIDEYQIESFVANISSGLSFVPQNHHFEIEGYCSNCVTR